jgi:hypothetical protein
MLAEKVDFNAETPCICSESSHTQIKHLIPKRKIVEKVFASDKDP